MKFRAEIRLALIFLSWRSWCRREVEISSPCAMIAFS